MQRFALCALVEFFLQDPDQANAIAVDGCQAD